MREKDAFSKLHPVVLLVYFVLEFVFAVWLLHPAALCISLAAALAYHARLCGAKSVRLAAALFPVCLFAALLNPLFSHAGVTILAYFPSGNPLTLESVVYGGAAALSLAASVTLFACLSAVMTSEKMTYLFGRAMPSLGLLLSMTLRFVPRFAARYRAVREAQETLGLRRSRKKTATAVLSATVTWALEGAVESADAMRARGWGSGERTSFTVYRFSARDRRMLLFFFVCGFFVLCGACGGGFRFRCYPSVRLAPLSPLSLAVWLAYAGFAFAPILYNGKEALRWKRSVSKS